MAFTLSGSVGRMGGLNRTEDVRKVQNALNKVPVPSGGPAKPLDPDGACGNKTIEAIQIFQIKHFGWSGADGRVDVNGPTHQKLNEFDGPVFLPGSTETPVLTSESITMRLDTGPTNNKRILEEWRFLVTDEANEITAIYRLHKTPDIRNTTVRSWGSPLDLSVDEPTTVDAFDGAKFGYTTALRYDAKEGSGGFTNTMALQPTGKGKRTYLYPPWTIVDPWENALRDPGTSKVYVSNVLGELRLVKMTDGLVAHREQAAVPRLQSLSRNLFAKTKG